MKRLYRSINNRMIGGVCGGFAEYFNIDPTILRLAYAILTLVSFGFVGVIVYIMCMVIIPLDDGIID